MGERRIRAAAPVTALTMITALVGFAACDGGAAQQNAQRVHSGDRRLGVVAVGPGTRVGSEARIIVLTGDGGYERHESSGDGDDPARDGSDDGAGGGVDEPGPDEPGPDEPWHEGYPGVSIDLVRGLSPGQAVRALYPDGLRRRASLDTAMDAADASYPEDDEADTAQLGWIAAGTIDGWTFVWEDNGYAGSDVKAAARASRKGRLVSVYWNVNALATFTVADQGRIVRQFEPIFHGEPENTIGRPLSAEAAFDWSDDADHEASMLALQSRLTGVPAADPAWLDRPGVQFWTYPR